MAGENDFFLKFGSNAGQFAREIEQGVDAAYAQIGRLERTMDGLNQKLRTSVAGDFMQSLQAEMRGIGKTIAATIGPELRAALTRELSGLGVNVDVQGTGTNPTTGGVGRTNATSTPEADRALATVAQIAKSLGAKAADLDKAIGFIDQALRTAGAEISDTSNMFRAAGERQQREMLALADKMRTLNSQIRTTSQRQEAAKNPIEREMAMGELSRLAAELQGLQTQLRAVATGAVQEPTRAREPAEAGVVGLDKEDLLALHQAAQTQEAAAEKFQTVVNKFDGHVDRLAAALNNIRVVTEAGTPPPAPTPLTSEGSAPPPSTKTPPATDFVAAEVNEVRRNLQTILGVFREENVPLSDPIAMGGAFNKYPEALNARTAILEATGQDKPGFARALGKLSDEANGVEEAMNLLEAKVREALGATDQVIGSTEKLAQENDELARQRQREQDASRAAAEASKPKGPVGPPTVDLPPERETLTTAEMNRQQRLASERARKLRDIIGSADAVEGAARLSEDVGAGQQVGRSTFDRRAILSRAFDELGIGRGSPHEQRRIQQQERRAQKNLVRQTTDLYQSQVKSLHGPEEDREYHLQRNKVHERMVQAAQEEVDSLKRARAARDAHTERLRRIFVGDETISTKDREWMRMATGSARAKTDPGDVGAHIVQTATMRSIADDPSFQRQVRMTRALELSDLLDDGKGSIQAATRGGSLETLNQRLAAAGVGEQVSSRAEAKALVPQLQRQLEELQAGFGPSDQEQFSQWQQLDKAARTQALETRRAFQAANQAVIEFATTTMRGTADLIPGGLAKAPEILAREASGRSWGWAEDAGTGAAYDPEMERVRQTQEALNVEDLAKRAEASRRAMAAITEVPDLTLSDLESVPTETSAQGEMKRLVLEELDRLDNAVVKQIADSVDPSLLKDVRPNEIGQAITDLYDVLPEPDDIRNAGALARVRERQALDLEAERTFRAKAEAGFDEEAFGRYITAEAGRRGVQPADMPDFDQIRERFMGRGSEAVQRGGLRALAEYVERPSDILDRERMSPLVEGGVRLRTLSPTQEDYVTGRYGEGGKPSDLSASLIRLYNEGIDEALQLSEQSLLRREAERSRETQENLRAQGFDVDEAEVAKAERILAKTADVPERFQAIMERLYTTPRFDAPEFELQGGQSLADMVFGGSKSLMDDVGGVDDSLTRVMQARADERALLAAKAGVDISAIEQPIGTPEDTPERRRELRREQIASLDAQIQERLGGETNVQEAYRQAEKIAVQRYNEEQRAAAAAKGIADRLQAAENALANAIAARRTGGTEQRLEAAVAAEEIRTQRQHQEIEKQKKAAGQLEGVEPKKHGTEAQQTAYEQMDWDYVARQRAALETQKMPTYEEARAGYEDVKDLDPELARRVAVGGATTDEMQEFIRQLGGMDQAVQRLGTSLGVLNQGSEDLTLSDLDEKIRNAPGRVSELQNRLAGFEAEAAEWTEIARTEPRGSTERADAEAEVRRAESGMASTRKALEAETVRASQAEAVLAERRARVAENTPMRAAIRQDLEGALKPSPRVVALQEEIGGYQGQRQEWLEISRQARPGSEDRAFAMAEVRDLDEKIQTARDALDVEAAGPQAAAEGLAEVANQRLREFNAAIARLEAILNRIGREAGIPMEQRQGARSIEDLRSIVAGRTEDVADVAEGVARGVAATQGGPMTDAEAAMVRAGARGTEPTLRMPTSDAALLNLERWLAGTSLQGEKAPRGFSNTLEQIRTKGQEMIGADVTGQQTRIRNQLALLAGPEFYQYAKPGWLEKHGVGEHPGTATARTDITQELYDAAMEGVVRTQAAVHTDPRLGDAKSRELDSRVSVKLLATLDSLEAAIVRLVDCCASMKQAGKAGVGAEAGPGVRDKAAEFVTTDRLRSRVQGRLGHEVAQKVAAGDLAEAAMELMADPNLGFNANEARRVVQSVVNENARNVGGDLFDKEQRAELDNRLLTAQRMQGISPAALDAYRQGDAQATAQAILVQTDDFEGALRQVGRAFDLTSDQVDAMRPALEAYNQQLQEERALKSVTDAPQLNAEQQLAMEQRGRALPGAAGQIYDAGAVDRPENARAVMAAMFEEGQSLPQVVTMLNRAYADLSVETRRVLEVEAQRANELRDTARATRMAEEAEERLQRLRSLLPGKLRAQLDAGQLTGQQVANYMQSTTPGQRLPMGQNNVRGLQTIIDEGMEVAQTGALSPERIADQQRVSGRRAGEAFVDQYTSSLQNMDIGSAIFGANGSMLANVIRTTGNFVGRYIGGAIVFGLAMRMRELIQVALETEQTFIRVSSALDATGKSADGVKTRLQDIAVATNVSLADTYEVMAQLVGVFDTVDEAARATEVVAQMELISQGALSAREGYRALSAVVTSFQETLMDERGLTNEGAITYVADLATRLQDVTGVNIEDTIEGVGRLGETANAMGIELEFLASTLALSGKATGQTGTVVSEAFGRVLSQLQDAKATDILVRMGITDDATVRARDFQQIMIDLFKNFENLNAGQKRQLGEVISDPRQFYIVNAALQQGVDILDIWEKSQNNAGAAAERTDAILNTLRGQIGQLGKQVQVLVENLVNLGVLNVFGVLVKGASILLSIVNKILQAFNGLMEASPFAKMALHIGMAVAGLKIMAMLVSSVFAQMGKYVGVPESTGVRDTIGGARDRRRAAREAAAMTDEIMAVQEPGGRARPRIGQRLGTVGERMTQWGEQVRTEGRLRTGHTGTDAAGWAARRVGSGITRGSDALSRSMGSLSRNMPRTAAAAGRLGGAMTSLGRDLRANAGAALGYAFALALVADMVMSKAREMQSYYDDLYSAQPKDDETDEDARIRTEREKRQEYVRSTTQDSNIWGAWRDDSKFSFTAAKNNLGENVSWFMDSPWEYLTSSRGEAASVMAGELKEPDQSYLDAQREALLNARDNMDGGQQTVDEVRKLEEELRAKADELIANQPTTAGKAEVERQVNALLGLAEAIDSSANAALHGLAGVTNFTMQQIDSTSSSLSFVSGMNNRMREQFGGLIRKMMGERGLPPEAIAAIDRANQAGMSAPDRLAAHIDAQDMLIRQAEVELAEAEGLDEIDRANQKLEELMNQRMEYENQLIQMLVDLPKGAGEYALRFGQYAEASRLLSQAADAARANAADEDPGSPEELNFLNQALDLERQMVEAGIAQVIQRLEYSSAITRDPMTQVGNSLEIARTRLEAAMENPGAFTPEEIAGFVNEIAQLHQQIADAQDEITSAMVALRIEQTGNPLEQANLSYAEALRQYNRAISEGMGAAAILNAAREAEAAARVVREQAEELRAARASLAIARLPQGDSIAVAMAQLSEAFDAQRHVIREFGRESAEYAASVQEVIDTRRAVQDAINDVAAAHASVASALASAAGLDIESARIDLGEAQRQLQVALAEAGGNENAASVQQAMADVIQAEAAMRDTVLDEATETIDFLMDMGDITANEAIAALQEIMATMDLTEDQRRNLMQKIKGLQDDIANSLSGGFNIADVRLPTPYEVRRSLGIDEINEGVEEGRAALADAFTAANEAFSPGAGGSVLDSVLGADLANEVRSVGTSVDALLPPISEVPGVIDATLASRDAIVAQLTSQLEAVYQLTTAQNESVGMLGATIFPPMELIQQQTALANEWLEISSNLQASGNEYLLHTMGEQYVHTEYLAAIAGTLSAMRDTSMRRFGMTQEAIDAEEERFRTGADLQRRRPREQLDTRERLQPRDINPPEFRPRDHEHQQAIDYFTSPAPYVPQTTTVTQQFDTHVTVQATTNADPNEIARTVETRVNNSLRRQMNSNQSTPHLIRMR